MTTIGVMDLRGRVFGRIGRALAVGLLAATLLVGVTGGDVSAQTSQEVACANMDMMFYNLANRAQAAYANGDTATGNALTQQLGNLLNRINEMGC